MNKVIGTWEVFEWLKELKAYREQSGDAISRQAVLDAFWKLNVELRPNAIDAILNMVNTMPSVTPQPCEDCISRQAVLNTIGNVPDYDDGMVWEALSHAQRDVALLPSVTPQQKTGRWVDDKCSVCGKGIEDLIASPEWYRDEEPNFCPFCGIKMESEGKE